MRFKSKFSVFGTTVEKDANNSEDVINDGDADVKQPSIDSTKTNESLNIPTDAKRIPSGPPKTRPLVGPPQTSPIGPPKTNPIIGPPKTNPIIGPPKTNPIVGPPKTNPIVGPPKTNQIVGPPKTNPIVGPSQTSPIIGPPQTHPIVGPPQTRPIIGPPQTHPIVGPSQSLPTTGTPKTSPISVIAPKAASHSRALEMNHTDLTSFLKSLGVFLERSDSEVLVYKDIKNNKLHYVKLGGFDKDSREIIRNASLQCDKEVQ